MNVHQDLLKLFDERRRKPALFASERDRSGQDRLVREQVAKLGGDVYLIPRTSQRDPTKPGTSAGVDALDGDILDPQFLTQDPSNLKTHVRALIEHQPSKQRLTKFGVEEQRDVIFHVPSSLLEELGLVEPNGKRFRGIAIGDFFEWDGSFYVVNEAHRTNYLGLSDSYYFTSAFCVRFQHNTTPKDPTGEAPKRAVFDPEVGE